MEDLLIIMVDIVSSSVRASPYDRTGRYVDGTEIQCPYSFKVASGAGAEVDADGLVDLIAHAVQETLSLVKDKADRIAVVATSTFWHSVLGVDQEERSATPILTWADRRAAVHRRTGCVLHSSYPPAKLLWLSRTSPEAYYRTERWISPGEYLHRRLFGRARGIGLLSHSVGARILYAAP